MLGSTAIRVCNDECRFIYGIAGYLPQVRLGIAQCAAATSHAGGAGNRAATRQNRS